MPANMPVKPFTPFAGTGRLLAEKQEPYHPEIVTYIPAHPHPMFGKDPNIIDAYGHTKYPMWVQINGKPVLVKDAEHERLLSDNSSS